MTSNTRTLLDTAKAYLQEQFTALSQAAGVKDIRLWQSGYTAVLNNSIDYPTCILTLGPTPIQPYMSTYKFVIGVAVNADVESDLEDLGYVWEDIIEEAIRNDYHLGGAVLDSNNIEINRAIVSGIYIIEASMDCTLVRRRWIHEKEDVDMS